MLFFFFMKLLNLSCNFSHKLGNTASIKGQVRKAQNYEKIQCILKVDKCVFFKCCLIWKWSMYWASGLDGRVPDNRLGPGPKWSLSSGRLRLVWGIPLVPTSPRTMLLLGYPPGNRCSTPYLHRASASVKWHRNRRLRLAWSLGITFVSPPEPLNTYMYRLRTFHPPIGPVAMKPPHQRPQ